MQIITPLLSILILLSASILILAEYRGPLRHIHIFKPLTMVFILLVAILGQGSEPFYKVMIITGLVFSMAGDILLMPPKDRFVAGLVAFLVGHLFYIAAFASEIQTLTWLPLLPLAICGGVLLAFLAPRLGKMKVPVTIYMVVILTMAWLAWARWLQTGQNGALLASIGALLFVISDSILALNRFRGPFPPGRALNLATYFAAQLLIAGSIGALVF